MYDIYVRVSKTGDKEETDSLRSVEIQEQECRAWADKNGAFIGEVVPEKNVSGGKAVEERELDRLVGKIEAGQSEGIITSYLDRFGRDVISSALALRRIIQAGGRLVCASDGFDSKSAGSTLVFNLRMSIAEDYLQRTRDNFLAAQNAAAERGVYLSAKPPVGYRRADEVDPKYTTLPNGAKKKHKDGRLVIDEREAAVVREVFRRRTEGANLAELGRYVAAELDRPSFTKQGIIAMLKRRTYLGEMTVQSGQKGQPRVVKGVVPAILTESEWQAAQRKGTYYPRNGVVAQGAYLAGLVVCATCGKRCKGGAYGPPDRRKPNYKCTYRDCDRHASMSASKLHPYVEQTLWQAMDDGDPHITAIMEGDMRYVEALEAVEQAHATFEEFRDDPRMQELLGMDGYATGLAARKAAVDAARSHLNTVPPASTSKVKIEKITDPLLPSYRAMYHDFIREIRLAPAEWHDQPAEGRVLVFWRGQESD